MEQLDLSENELMGDEFCGWLAKFLKEMPHTTVCLQGNPQVLWKQRRGEIEKKLGDAIASGKLRLDD